MKITESAKEIIMGILESNNSEAIVMSTQSSCCGNSLSFDLVEKSEGMNVEIVDGVPAIIDEETHAWTSEVTIDSTDDGGLTLINPNPMGGCSSCGGGCH